MTEENGKYIQCWHLNDVLEILKKCDYSDKDIKGLYVIKKESIMKRPPRPPSPFEVMTFANLDWR